MQYVLIVNVRTDAEFAGIQERLRIRGFSYSVDSRGGLAVTVKTPDFNKSVYITASLAKSFPNAIFSGKVE